MTTVVYGRYVCVNEEAGQILWYENEQSALKDSKKIGGVIYDVEMDDIEDIERALKKARRNAGVE